MPKRPNDTTLDAEHDGQSWQVPEPSVPAVPTQPVRSGNLVQATARSWVGRILAGQERRSIKDATHLYKLTTKQLEAETALITAVTAKEEAIQRLEEVQMKNLFRSERCAALREEYERDFQEKQRQRERAEHERRAERQANKQHRQIDRLEAKNEKLKRKLENAKLKADRAAQKGQAQAEVVAHPARRERRG